MASAHRVLLLLCFVLSCSTGEKCKATKSKVSLKEDLYGDCEKGIVKRFTWKNTNGVEVQVITYGGRIISLKLPDRNGKIVDVVLGYDNIKDYVKDKTYFGAILGRTANRITGASFSLGGKKYKLTANQNEDSFHGGTTGFSHEIWEPYVRGTELTLSYYSPDGQDGFPGAVVVHVTYELTEDNEFKFNVRATTTKPTPITIGNHAYYNLAGHNAGSQGTYQHKVIINAEKILQYNDAGQPTGEIESVKDTCYDFQNERNLGKMINVCGSYDNYFCLHKKSIGNIVFVARIYHKESGRALNVYSDQPGCVFYTGKNLPKKGTPPVVGKGGAKYYQNASMCLETHGYPDAVNQPHFPSVILHPGEVYTHTTHYKFSVEK